MLRGQHKDCCEIEEAGQLRLIAKSTETHARQTGGLLLQHLPLAAVAHNHQLCLLKVPSSQQPAVCLDEIRTPLPRLQLRGKEDDWLRRVQIDLADERATAPLRLLAALPEKVIVDRVGHGELRHARAEVVGPVTAVVRADRQHSVHHGLERTKEELLRRQLAAGAIAVGQPRFCSQKHRNAQRVGGRHAVKRICGRVAMHPESVKRRRGVLAAQT